ncbi:MAG: ATPase domain-containing protein [Myxococcales bacterium]|nr:AAA family ATPase [Myxococcales bacterium]
MSEQRVTTGISGLDDILAGGLPARRLHLVQGDPGAGKTTIGLQFLLEGVRRGERGLYITLSETREELTEVAASHGFDISKLALFELASTGARLDIEEQNTLFEPSEVELAELTRALLAQIDDVRPKRVVFDSLSEMRLLAQSPLRYRRQVLSLKQHLAERGCTVLMLDDQTSEVGDLHLQSLAHGVIVLQHLSPLYGAERRRLRVVKMRGVAVRGGFHDFRIRSGGVQVFPRLVAAEHHDTFPAGLIESGLQPLDELLGGGLDRGTSALFMGPAGTGKSALAMHFAVSATRRNEAAAVYAFDEGLYTLGLRCAALGIDLKGPIASGKLRIRQVNPAELSPGEFVAQVCSDVERNGAKVVVIDSLNGYMTAMPEEQFLTIQMHELLTFLRQRGVVIILVVAQQGLIGSMSTPVEVSYLADTVVLLRFFETAGAVRKAISVLKRRSGRHGSKIHELSMDANGIRVGAALDKFVGVLTGVPHPAAAP